MPSFGQNASGDLTLSFIEASRILQLSQTGSTALIGLPSSLKVNPRDRTQLFA